MKLSLYMYLHVMFTHARSSGMMISKVQVNLYICVWALLISELAGNQFMAISQ